MYQLLWLLKNSLTLLTNSGHGGKSFRCPTQCTLRSDHSTTKCTDIAIVRLGCLANLVKYTTYTRMKTVNTGQPIIMGMDLVVFGVLWYCLSVAVVVVSRLVDRHPDSMDCTEWNEGETNQDGSSMLPSSIHLHGHWKSRCIWSCFLLIVSIEETRRDEMITRFHSHIPREEWQSLHIIVNDRITCMCSK